MSVWPKCGSCRFFAISGEMAGDGGCQRHAPIMGGDAPRWPIVHIAEWCNEHERATPVAKTSPSSQVIHTVYSEAGGIPVFVARVDLPDAEDGRLSGEACRSYKEAIGSLILERPEAFGVEIRPVR